MYRSTYFLPKDFAIEVDKTYKNHNEIEYQSDFDVYENVVITITQGFMCDSILNERNDLVTAYSNWVDISQIAPSDLIPEQEINYKSINKLSETVIYAGIMVDHFGHFIIDTLNRLWYFIKYNDQKHKIVFTHYKYKEYSSRPSFQNEFLKLLGIPTERVLVIDEPTFFEKVIVPKQSVYWYSSYNKALLGLIYDKLAKSVTPKRCDKVYISKTKVVESDSFLFNEEYFEEFFSSHGFEVIYPEQLSVQDQISYMSGAKVIACTSGTLSHLVMFANQDVKLICLMRSNLDLWLRFLDRQIIINMVKNVNCIFVDVSLNFIPLVFIENSHLIGPSAYWKEFIKDEYGIDIVPDVYEYMDSAGIKLGSYLKGFTGKMNEYRLGYITYYLSLLRTFNATEYNDIIENLYSHRAFTRQSYKFRSVNRNVYCIVRLNMDGTITRISGSLYDNECHWAFIQGKLYFFNPYFHGAKEFIVHTLERGTFIKSKYYLGNSIPGPGDIYELVEIQHKFLRIIIKLLVSKKVYKKFKNDPLNFFKDSKSRVIKFLGKYYY